MRWVHSLRMSGGQAQTRCEERSGPLVRAKAVDVGGRKLPPHDAIFIAIKPQFLISSSTIQLILSRPPSRLADRMSIVAYWDTNTRWRVSKMYRRLMAYSTDRFQSLLSRDGATRIEGLSTESMVLYLLRRVVIWTRPLLSWPAPKERIHL